MKILLADDHALFRDGMRYVLKKLDEKVVVLDAGSFPDALNTAKQNPDLDLALLDLHMRVVPALLLLNCFIRIIPIFL
ncbi:MAG: hypothetical protein WDM70_03475 [Nitrosomonadales bacterium]